MPPSYPLYRTTAKRDRPLTQACRPADDGGRVRLWATTRSTPSSRPTSPRRPGTAAARRLPPQTATDDRRRLSAKASTGPGTRAAGRTPTATSAARAGRTGHGRDLRRPGHDGRRRVSELPRPACSSSTTSRSTTSPTSRRAPPLGPATCGTRPEFLRPGDRLVDACNLQPVSFMKPIGAENEHPGYASVSSGSQHLVELLSAIDGWGLRQGHDGHRDLRRVRRPVGSRPAAGPGRRRRAARPVGAGHADPGADPRPAACRRTSSSTTRVRHDVDAGNHRAPLRPRPAGAPRRERQRSQRVFTAQAPGS